MSPHQYHEHVVCYRQNRSHLFNEILELLIISRTQYFMAESWQIPSKLYNIRYSRNVQAFAWAVNLHRLPVAMQIILYLFRLILLSKGNMLRMKLWFICKRSKIGEFCCGLENNHSLCTKNGVWNLIGRKQRTCKLRKCFWSWAIRICVEFPISH